MIDHVFSGVAHRTNLSLVILQFTHQALMLSQQILHADQVAASIGRHDARLFLARSTTVIPASCSLLCSPDPSLFVFDVVQETLKLRRCVQLLLLLLQRVEQRLKTRDQLNLLLENVIGIEVTDLLEVLGILG